MGGQGSGGPNGGPQYNPANISATGGNGQSGNNTQAAKYIPGMKSMGSTGVATMAQQTGADMYAAPDVPALPEVTPITAPSELPDQSVLHGLSPLGQPNNIPGAPTSQDTSADKIRLQQYLPALESAAAMPNSSEAFRNYVRLIRASV